MRLTRSKCLLCDFSVDFSGINWDFSVDPQLEAGAKHKEAVVTGRVLTDRAIAARLAWLPGTGVAGIGVRVLFSYGLATSPSHVLPLLSKVPLPAHPSHNSQH